MEHDFDRYDGGDGEYVAKLVSTDNIGIPSSNDAFKASLELKDEAISFLERPLMLFLLLLIRGDIDVELLRLLLCGVLIEKRAGESVVPMNWLSSLLLLLSPLLLLPPTLFVRLIPLPAIELIRLWEFLYCKLVFSLT